jgi:hypothetical protein
MSERVVDATASLPQICCGQRLKQIDIRSSDSTLSFTYCGSCEAMRWFRDGLPTEGDALKGLLRSTPSGRQVARG